MPLVDVLMPVKNGARFLPAALDSLAAQTMRDFRLLACDDGSTDDTAAILRRETRFPVTMVAHASSVGVARALNTLLDLSSDSRYLARFDGDDLCHPERLQRQVDFLEAHPDVGIVGSAMEIIDEKGATTGHNHYPRDPDGVACELLFSDPLAHPAVMLRANIFRGDNAARYDQAYTVTEDYELWCRLSTTTRMANLPEPLVRYRRHAQAVGVSRRNAQLVEIASIRRQQVDRLSLPAESRALLLSALGLDPQPSRVAAAAARRLLAVLDARFDAAGSAHYRVRRAEIALGLSVRMGRLAKLQFLLGDGDVRRAYLRARSKPGDARREIRQQQLDRQRLGRSLSAQIIGQDGQCGEDLRIYGDGRAGQRISFGQQTIIEHGCSLWISPPEYHRNGMLRAGENLFLGSNCRINVYDDIRIGARVLIGANSYLTTNNHEYRQRDVPIQSQGFTGAPITIGDDVWLGCNVVVLPGVTIGNGAVIGAGSVVTRDVPAGEVWAGVPARKIKAR